MRVKEIREHCKLDDQTQSLMRSAMTQLKLSARAYHRILKLARTIADLAGSEDVQSVHLAEALQYRDKDPLWIRLKYRDILSSIFFIQIAMPLYPSIQPAPQIDNMLKALRF